jgi:hypothetical protein
MNRTRWWIGCSLLLYGYAEWGFSPLPARAAADDPEQTLAEPEAFGASSLEAPDARPRQSLQAASVVDRALVVNGVLARERSLWRSVMRPYLADPLWLDRDAYDTGHNLLIPVHAAWVTRDANWIRDLRSHLRRFMDGGVDELAEEILDRVHYLYVWTRYAALAAERGAADRLVRDFVVFADAEVRRLWLEIPAWMWDRPDFANMRERVLWKLDAVDPEQSYYRAITDHELFVFAMAGDLQSYARNTGFRPSPAVKDILNVAYRVFTTEVSWESDGGWLFQPGVWEDHPHFAFAGHTEKGTDLLPLPVPGIAEDSSHSIRFPAWLRSLEGASPRGSERRRLYSRLLAGLERQFFGHVAVPPSRKFDGWRTTNYMDGWNGLYRWHHDTQGNDGFGPYQLSGTMFIGWWSLLGTRRSTHMHRDIAGQFPLSPEQVAYYVGPNTTRVRHPLATEPDVFVNGVNELLILLATRVGDAFQKQASR